MTTTKNRFSAAMSTCSWLSAVLIVFVHAYNIEVYGSQNPVCYWIQQVISQGLARGAVPFFMFSSAYFLYSRERKVGEVYLTVPKYGEGSGKVNIVLNEALKDYDAISRDDVPIPSGAKIRVMEIDENGMMVVQRLSEEEV